MVYRKILLSLFIFLVGFAVGRFTVPTNTSEESSNIESNTSISQSESIPAERRNFPEKMWVETTIVNVRSNPSLEAPIQDQLFRGDSVVVQDTTGEWSRIDLEDNLEGWIFSPLLSELKVAPLPAVQVRDAKQSVIEKNNLWWRYSYQVTLAVNRPTRDNKKVTIKFVDSDGYALDNDITYLPMFNRPQEHTIRDSKLIDVPLAENVNTIVVSIE